MRLLTTCTQTCFCMFWFPLHARKLVSACFGSQTGNSSWLRPNVLHVRFCAANPLRHHDTLCHRRSTQARHVHLKLHTAQPPGSSNGTTHVTYKLGKLSLTSCMPAETDAQLHQKAFLRLRLLENILSSVFLAVLSVVQHAATAVMPVLYCTT